jgi:large subunit ribosomal protein L6
MSKIGKQPIKIPAGVAIAITADGITVKGAKGEFLFPVLRGVKPAIAEGVLTLTLISNSKQTRSNWGTLRAIINNAVIGLTKGFEKTLILEGIGYKINKEGNDLVMNLGFSHPVRYVKPENIVFEIEKNTILKIKGFDKNLVGRVAADIRDLKKPEPYKGTGFRYSDEVVKRKAGKKAATAAGGA